MRVAVTGATGQIGGGVARRLAGTRVVEAEFEDCRRVRGALRGVGVVLMVSASEPAARPWYPICGSTQRQL